MDCVGADNCVGGGLRELCGLLLEHSTLNSPAQTLKGRSSHFYRSTDRRCIPHIYRAPAWVALALSSVVEQKSRR